MRRVDGMGRREVAYLVVVVVCSVLFMTTHDLISQAYGWLINGLDRRVVENFLNWGSVALAVAFLLLVARRSVSWCFVVEAAVLGTLLWASNTLLICTNVERIHYPQYALLGFLIRGLVDGDVLALLAGNLIGMMDEALQYALNPQYTKYLDFNDMILNMIGVMVGIAVWRWLGHSRFAPGMRSFWRRVLGVGYGLLAALVAMAVLLGKVIQYWPTTEIPHTVMQNGGRGLGFVLSFVDLSQFWMVTGLGRKYHIMNSVEWAGALFFLLFATWGLSRWCGRPAAIHGVL